MLDMPKLKFDKSIKYLKAQIDIQKNNKSLILDIISNIGLILNNSSEENNEKLQSVLDTANNFLQNISNNITSLEQLDLEISNITSDLNEIVSSQSKGSKTKEYYIAAFSNIKNNIVQYTQNFQNMENKLDIDNNAFNDFIKDNDFKYTFNAVDNQSENTYELASFSINNEATSISADLETSNVSDEDIIDNGVEEALAENITEETVVEEVNNNEAENSSVEETGSEVVESPVAVVENSEKNLDELTNDIKSLLVDFSDNKISEFEFNNSISELKSRISSINNNSVNDEQPIIEEVSVEEIFAEDEQSVVEEIAEDNQPFVEETIVENVIDEVNEQPIIDNLENVSEDNVEASIIETSIDHSINSIVENQKQHIEDRHHSIEELIKKIKSAEDKNKTLLISEKTNKVYLPYRITELQNYMEYYPKAYKSLSDVVEQEFIISLDTFARHPSKARFSETYNLVRNRSGKSVLKALSYAIKLRNKRSIDPAVIAACKNEYELHCYLYCLEQHKIDSFKFFNIVYDVSLF